METKRQTKIIRIISDYDEVNRSYIAGLVEKEDVDEALERAEKRIVRMELTDEEKEYSIKLAADCFERISGRLRIPKELRLKNL